MKKSAFLTTYIFCLTVIVFAQPVIQWQNNIGGNDHDQLFSVQQTIDGGYILGGYSSSDSSGDKTQNSKGLEDYWVIKLYTNGNIQWQKTIGGNSTDILNEIQQTTDGGYILGGYSHSNISGNKTENSIGINDYWIVKLNSNGNIQWQNTIGGSSVDELYAIQQTADGGYILGGRSQSDSSADKAENNIGLSDYWIVKVNSVGIIQWENTIGGNSRDYLISIKQAPDGGYVLGGLSESPISGDKTENCNGDFDYWIVKTDATGNIQWQKTIGGNAFDALYTIEVTNDGGFILGGSSTSNISGNKTENSQGGKDYWIVKLDSTGTIEWQNNIGGNFDDDLQSVQQTTDNGYILGGASSSSVSGDKTVPNCAAIDDYWIIKVNSSGSIVWQKDIGGYSDDRLYSVKQTSDLGYILGGWSNSDNGCDKTEDAYDLEDYWVIKLTPDTITGIYKNEYSFSDYAIFPNPIVDNFIIRYDSKQQQEIKISFLDITGKQLHTITKKATGGLNKISFSIYELNLAPGIYFVQISNGVFSETKKLVVIN